ncbi:MAG TPA: coenzyme F420-0:L-glutamate ligase [Candidatus Paceibacterota bacterium]|nr:coenzyme F420-0:L-glutamate ligase [Candidatus Paceibacterota bacterium]
MLVKPFKTRVFKEDEELVTFITEHIASLKNGSILAITSKIVALSEGRTALLSTSADRDRIIKEESEFALRTEHTWLTIKDGAVMASAGVDESNADGKLVLLPKDSFATAAKVRTQLQKHYGITNLGIVITDSRTLPLRRGVVGVALGYAGFKGIRNYIGTPDIFGRLLKISRTDVADGIATAVVLEMGEGNEQQPLAVVENAPVEWTDSIDPNELKISLKDDMYRPLFEHLPDISL